MVRTILHFDLDAFFCAVEELQNPELKGKAFAVGSAADSRGVVASASYPARVFGVRSAMPMGQAKRLCPELLVIPAHHKLYSDYSARVMALLHELTPFVEQLSIDEAFLDVTGISGSGDSIARQLQMTIRNKLGLSALLGVASNKMVAKIANNMGKARNKSGQAPAAIEVVPDDEEAAYLAPLLVIELWGIGPKKSRANERARYSYHWRYCLAKRTIYDLSIRQEWPRYAASSARNRCTTRRNRARDKIHQ